jgi:hypothetical protein
VLKNQLVSNFDIKGVPDCGGHLFSSFPVFEECNMFGCMRNSLCQKYSVIFVQHKLLETEDKLPSNATVAFPVRNSFLLDQEGHM